MKLRGIDFGNILGASGVQGFFGEGYWFHHIPFIGADFTGMTFVAKTATFFERRGNMVLNENHVPKRFFPSCVKVKFRKGVALNAVGLSNPGIGQLLASGRWQNRQEPFMISVMSLAETREKRMKELGDIINLIKLYEHRMGSFGLQINLSCPNTGHNPTELISESAQALEIASTLEVPLMPKYSIASASLEAVMELNDNPHCDGICVSNTLPFGWEGIDWKKVWGTDKSPLEKRGGGGLSGGVLCPLVCEYIGHLRDAGFTKPINGGGGILSCQDVDRYFWFGASSVFLGSVAFLRPWRVQSIIRHANSLNWRRCEYQKSNSSLV